MQREPLLSVATATAAATAVLTALIAFGIDLTDAQSAALLGLVAVIAPLVVAVVARPVVTPTSEVVAQLVPGDVERAGPASHLPNGAPVAVEPAAFPEGH